MVNVLERENQTFDYIYDWTTNLNIKQRKKGENSVSKKKLRRKSHKHYTTNHEKLSDGDANIRLKVKDVESEEETEFANSNKAEIDEFDAPKNQSTQGETQCCSM